MKGRSLRRRIAAAGSCAALVFALAGTSPALAAEDEYDAADAGNPVRITAYVLHPVGVIYDYLILRPAWWVGSHEPFRTFFGRTD